MVLQGTLCLGDRGSISSHFLYPRKDTAAVLRTEHFDPRADRMPTGVIATSIDPTIVNCPTKPHQTVDCHRHHQVMCAHAAMRAHEAPADVVDADDVPAAVTQPTNFQQLPFQTTEDIRHAS